MSEKDITGQSLAQLSHYTLQEKIISNNVYTLYASIAEDGTAVFIEQLVVPDATLIKRFDERVRILASSDHASIPPIIESGKDEKGQPFVVYGPLAGSLLSQLLQSESRSFSEIESLAIGKKIAESFANLRYLSLIHLDLRPENIFITHDEEVLLLSLASPHTANLENQPFSKEFMDYASPEQLAAKPLQSQSNVYSLGVMLYSLLAGHPPKYQITDWDIFSQQSDIPYIPLSRAAPNLSPESYQLVRQCLGRQTWSRFGQPTDLIIAFDKAINAASTSSHEEVKSSIPVSLPKDNRMLWGGSALLLALIIIGILAVFRANQIRENSNIPNTPIPVVVDEPTATPTRTRRAATRTAVPNEVSLLEPVDGANFTNEDQIRFAWAWTNELEKDELFVLILRMGNQIVYQVEVDESAGEDRYEHEADLSNIVEQSGVYDWQIILQEMDGSINYSSPKGEFEVVVQTPTPTQTATPAVTATPSLTPTPTPTQTSEACVPSLPTGWVRYSYKATDLLFNLAIQTGTTVDEIERVSCVSATTISPGTEIFLPFSPATATPPPTNTPEPESGGGNSGGGGGGGNNPPPPPPSTPTPPSLPGG